MHLMRIWKRLRTFPRASRGVAMLEMALGFPLVLAIGGYGAELSNFAIVNQRVNQAALQLADNASRISNIVTSNGLTTFQLREVDLNDVLQGTRLTGAGTKLTKYGRITVTSLENVQQSYDSTPVQRMHWQRCIGQNAAAGYDSNYGTTPTTAGSTATQANAGTTKTAGMGDLGSEVNAPSGTGVIFVEVNYEYQPLFGPLFKAKTKIHYIASFIVRDKRDFSQIFNPTPASTASTCDLHNA